MKTCACCKQEKPKSNFSKAAKYSDKLYVYCRACVRLKSLARLQARVITPELKELWRQRSIKRRSTTEGRAEIRAANRAHYAKKRQDPVYRAANNLKSLVYHKTHPNGMYAKAKKDPLFALSVRARSLVKMALKNKRVAKASKTEAILGCDYEFFSLYLELQFTEGMSWDNMGAWHLDHKTPISWAKTEEEVLALNHFSNFQPLWAKDNLAKSNKFSSSNISWIVDPP